MTILGVSIHTPYLLAAASTILSVQTKPMTTTQNLRSLIAHTLTEIDREFHGWI